MSDRIWLALYRHGQFLESLTLYVRRLESIIIQTILVTFPRLEHLVVEPSQSQGIMNLDSLRSMPTWASYRTLRVLALQFQGGFPISHPDVTAIDPDWVTLYPKAHPDVLRLYGRLSNLPQLKSLLIGVQHRHSFTQFTEAGLVGFDFSLQSGLPILKTLKQLKTLLFYPKRYTFDPWDEEGGDHGLYEPQIGPEQAKWMIQHWPSLDEIRQVEVEKGPNAKVRAAREDAQRAARTITEIDAKISALKATLFEDRVANLLAEA